MFGPDSVYAYETGGVPVDIPSLTFSDLKSFHASKYHPSNSLMTSYGDLSVLDSLERVDTLVMDKFEERGTFLGLGMLGLVLLYLVIILIKFT